MIGLGPHTLSQGDWLFVALLQLFLIVAAALAVWSAAGRPPLGKLTSRFHRSSERSAR